MLRKFWCWLWGHKTLAKAYTGETYVATNLLGDQHIGKFYVWKRFDFCLRCNADIKKKEEGQ